MKKYRVQLLHKIEAETPMAAVEAVIGELTSLGLSNLVYRVIEVDDDGNETEYMASLLGAIPMEEALREFFDAEDAEDDDDDEDEDDDDDEDEEAGQPGDLIAHAETIAPIALEEVEEVECTRCHETSGSVNERGMCASCVVDIVGAPA